MPRPRFATADAQLRERLLDEARKEFATHGYDGASLNRILLAAGVSKGAYYYYFDDKVDLAMTVLAEETRLSAAALADLRMPDTVEAFWVEFRRNSLERLRDMQRERVRYECLIRLANALTKHPELMTRAAPLFEESRNVIAEFFRRGQQIGAIRTDLPVPLLLEMAQSLKMTTYGAMFPGDQVLTQEQMDSFTDLMLDLARRLFAPLR